MQRDVVLCHERHVFLWVFFIRVKTPANTNNTTQVCLSGKVKGSAVVREGWGKAAHTIVLTPNFFRKPKFFSFGYPDR